MTFDLIKYHFIISRKVLAAEIEKNYSEKIEPELFHEPNHGLYSKLTGFFQIFGSVDSLFGVR